MDVLDTDAENDTDRVVNVPEPNAVLNGSGKRPLETSEENDEGEQKKSKINDWDDDGGPAMSKRELKKLARQQKWLEGKASRRESNKERRRKKKEWKSQMREAGIIVPKVKTTKMALSTCKQRVVLDMSYDKMMTFKDLCKCSNQLLRCYGVNRRMENPMQLHICNYGGRIKEVMSKHNGCEFWDIKYLEDSFDKIFEKEEIIYLTSDSTNVLDSIDESKVYIIGGLVDHNSCKGASLKLAESLGIAHARLPINEYITMKTRKILTINHVYEIISKVVTGVSWKDAFMSTLPKRKLFSAKDEDDSMEDCEDLLNDDRVDENKCGLDTKSNDDQVDENKCGVDTKSNDDQVDENKCGADTKSDDESNSTEQNTTVVQLNVEK